MRAKKESEIKLSVFGDSLDENEILILKDILSAIGIPNDFFEDINNYFRRNSKEVIFSNKKSRLICSRCLKAFIYIDAKEKGIDLKLANVLTLFDCPIGHLGYYIDGRKIAHIV